MATVVIRNPARRNAMTPAMWRQLPALLDGLEPTRRSVRWCSPAPATPSARAPTSATWTNCWPPVTAASRSPPRSGWRPSPSRPSRPSGAPAWRRMQLAVACDLRIAAADARFGVPPARLGLVYPAPTTRRLARLVGPSAAKHLLFTGRADRRRAGPAGIGLVDEVLARRAARRQRGGRSPATIAAALADSASPPPRRSSTVGPTRARIAWWHRAGAGERRGPGGRRGRPRTATPRSPGPTAAERAGASVRGDRSP